MEELDPGNPFANNPLINLGNPFQGYNDSIEKFKNDPELVAFDRMCYELFEHNELGRKFMEWIMINKILPSSSEKNSPFYQVHILWGEGYKDFWRDIYKAIISHKQRIQAEVNKKPEAK